METPQATRPTVVTVFGVLFIIGGAFGILSSLGAILMGVAFSVSRLPMPPAGEVPLFVMQMFSLMRYAWVLGLFWLAVSGLQLAAAIALLRLRAWGRTLLETLVWPNAVFLVGYTIWWAASFGRSGPWIAAHSGSNGPPAAVFTAFSLAGAGLSLIVGLAVNGVFLYFLRSKPVREAMQP